MKIEVPVLIKDDPARLDTATRYLLWDNYFDKVLIEKIEALREEGVNQPLLSGEEQIVYFWFYRMSYGYGYRACDMSQKLLSKKLKWSINKVKRCLRSLRQKEIIRPILDPFKNKRPTVYEVIFPRQLLRRQLNKVREDHRDKAAQKAFREISEILEGSKVSKMNGYYPKRALSEIDIEIIPTISILDMVFVPTVSKMDIYKINYLK